MAEQRGGQPYEPRDIGGFGALAGAALLLVAVLGPLLLVTWLYGAFWHYAEAPPPPLGVPPPDGVTAAPTLQINPGHDLAVFRKQVGARLGALGWVDRERGIAHIPIDEAMRLRLRRGWPEEGGG